jgi:nucleotide-binding universal stress UspA family protein
MQFRNILIPTDFSGSAEHAVQHALTLAARE